MMQQMTAAAGGNRKINFVWLRTKELSQSHKTVATEHTGCETKAFISDNSDLTRLKPFWAFYLEKED